MRTAMPNNLFSPTVEWPIPAPVLYVALGIIGACLILHVLILLARHLERIERRHNRFECLARNLGLTPTEMICLSHCGTDLGIEDKSQLLSDPELFQHVVTWAEEDRTRRVLIKKIQAKLEAHGRMPAHPAQGAPKSTPTMAQKGAIRRSYPSHA